MFRCFIINIIKDYLLLFENLIFLFNILILAFWNKQSCLDFALISIMPKFAKIMFLLFH